MKVPLEWLKELVTIRLPPELLAERLTMTGLEVTGIERANGETIFDIEVTPNRADCLSMIGVAREIAITTNQQLKLPAAKKTARPAHRTPRPNTKLAIRLEDRQGCVRYIGRLLDDVRIGVSPEWMQRRLIASGVRPINNVVDVTNYVLLEYGQPLHAFDFERLAKGTVLVRRAHTNESITTLDGVKRALSSEMLVIADAAQAVAVAGVMGGMGSEVTQQTRTILLESALFDPVTVRRAARKLGLTSESSYRFERGVDPVGVETASQRASALIQELAGGDEVATEDVGTKPLKRTGIIVDPSRASRWLGISLSPTAIRTTLAKLGCHVASAGTREAMHVSPPSFRRDLLQEVDLYEELARLQGYERLPATVPTVSMAAQRFDETVAYQRRQSLRCLCVSLGLTEAITWSLVSEKDLTRCSFPVPQVARLANPLSQDHAYLRPSLLIGLLEAIRRNLAHGASSLAFFEVGHVVPVGQHAESVHVGILLTGQWRGDWRTNGEFCDFFVLKGLIHALTSRLCRGTLGVEQASHAWAAPRSGVVWQLDGQPIGVAGMVARPITESLDINLKGVAKHGVWFAELSVEALLAFHRPVPMIVAPTTFPSAKRDISVLVPESTSFAAADHVIREVVGHHAARVELIDRFTKGEQIPAGKYSLTFSIEYQDASRTLTAGEVDAIHQRVGQMLVSRLGAVLR